MLKFPIFQKQSFYLSCGIHKVIETYWHEPFIFKMRENDIECNKWWKFQKNDINMDTEK